MRWKRSKSAIRNTGWAPYHLVIRDSGKKIVAACPLYLKTHSMGEFVFDHGWAEAAQRCEHQVLSEAVGGCAVYPAYRTAISHRAQRRNRHQMIGTLGRALMNLCTRKQTLVGARDFLRCR